MVSFDDVVPRLLSRCEADAEFSAQVTRALLVRDLRGRARLVLEGASEELARRLEESLSRELGKWFRGPILTNQGPNAARQRLAQDLLHTRWQDWPAGWPSEVRPLPADPPVNLRDRWRGIQAVFSKASWVLPTRSRTPWPLVPRAPRITAFYSFKGGVGRTTLLALLALGLARRGQRVVCIDMDLEAPGLASLLLGRPIRIGEPNVLEWLLQHAALGEEGAPPLVEAPVHGQTIHLAPAGVLGGSYLEKLARLDLMRQSDDTLHSPVGEALQALLARIRREINPHHILLDCRAGLHDLGGLALNEIAHVDVLVGRDSPQDLEGLSLVLEMLGRQRPASERRLLVVQTMPAVENVSPAWRRLYLQSYQDHIYQLFLQHNLYEEGDPPSPEDDQAAHYPWPVQYKGELAVLRSLPEVATATTFASDYGHILDRLRVLWGDEEQT